MMQQPSPVKAALSLLADTWVELNEELYAIAADANDGGCPIAWMQTWAPGPHYQMSCDFSAVLSPALFDEFIVPELRTYLQVNEFAVYHWDEADAVKYLDSLLAIDGIDAIQWTQGAGSPPASDPRWIPLSQDPGSRQEVDPALRGDQRGRGPAGSDSGRTACSSGRPLRARRKLETCCAGWKAGRGTDDRVCPEPGSDLPHRAPAPVAPTGGHQVLPHRSRTLDIQATPVRRPAARRDASRSDSCVAPDAATAVASVSQPWAARLRPVMSLAGRGLVVAIRASCHVACSPTGNRARHELDFLLCRRRAGGRGSVQLEPPRAGPGHGRTPGGVACHRAGVVAMRSSPEPRRPPSSRPSRHRDPGHRPRSSTPAGRAPRAT